MKSMPEAPAACPHLVARVNPIPKVTASMASAGAPIVIDGLDMSYWNALPLAQLSKQPYSFAQSSVDFSDEGVRNFYVINPTFLKQVFDSATNASPFIYTYTGAIDQASIARYGFRPESCDTRWFSNAGDVNDPKGVNQSIATLSGHLWSWYQPTPLMAIGSVVLPLAPDLLPGTKFEYVPFKDNIPWTFYVESVTHNYEFGSNVAATVLGLSRGLPTSVYADTEMVQNMIQGNVTRLNGVYEIGLPRGSGVPLTSYSLGNLKQLFATINQLYVTPQAPPVTSP
jgi:hypothetical protein